MPSESPNTELKNAYSVNYLNKTKKRVLLFSISTGVIGGMILGITLINTTGESIPDKTVLQAETAIITPTLTDDNSTEVLGESEPTGSASVSTKNSNEEK